VNIAHDRCRLAALEKVEPQPLQKDRGDILRALIAANGGEDAGERRPAEDAPGKRTILLAPL